MKILSHYWLRYSKKLIAKILNPKSAGIFLAEEAVARQMRLVIGKEGSLKEGNCLWLYWLVDESDGVIADAKFQAFGHSSLIGAAEVACELVLRKSYEKATRISADLVDRHVRDKNDLPAFPEEASSYLNLVLSAIEAAADQCTDIPFIEELHSPPVFSEQSGEIYSGWEGLTSSQKIEVIEGVIATDIRPYVELDAGGVRVLNLLEDREVVIAYQGACTSCYSATGSTLNAIQQILRAKVHPNLIVTPDMTFLEIE